MKESKWVDVINDVIVIPDPKTVCSLLRIYSPLVSRRFEELIQNHQGQRSHQVCLSNRVISISNKPSVYSTVQVSPVHLSVLPTTCGTTTSDQQGREYTWFLCRYSMNTLHWPYSSCVKGHVKLWTQDICIWLRMEQEIKSMSGGGAEYCVWAARLTPHCNNDFGKAGFIDDILLHNCLPQK